MMHGRKKHQISFIFSIGIILELEIGQQISTSLSGSILTPWHYGSSFPWWHW